MELRELKNLLTLSWKEETCSPELRSEWELSNPSLGQCAITALIVNDVYGGKIMRCMTSSGSHYYNLLDDGRRVDLTVDQFWGEIPKYEEGQEKSREYLLGNNDTKTRYLMLKENLKDVYDGVVLVSKIETSVDAASKITKDIEKVFGDFYRSCAKFYIDDKGMIKQRKKDRLF